MNPLHGAYQRVARARHHLSDLESEEQAISREIADKSVFEVEERLTALPDGREAVLPSHSFRAGTADIGPLVSILVGEVIYNLRAALDYLIYELAKRDSGKIQQGTQFPIEKSPAAYKARCNEAAERGVYLRGLSPGHKWAIKDYQPCFGCDWTRGLQALSNPDKHRELTVVTSHVTVQMVSDGVDLEANGTGIIPLTMHMEGQPESHITFSDATRVIPTLEQIASQVLDTLDEFRPCFEGACSHSPHPNPA